MVSLPWVLPAYPLLKIIPTNGEVAAGYVKRAIEGLFVQEFGFNRHGTLSSESSSPPPYATNYNHQRNVSCLWLKYHPCFLQHLRNTWHLPSGGCQGIFPDMHSLKWGVQRLKLSPRVYSKGVNVLSRV